MEQKYDVVPQATLQLDGRRVTRSTIVHDWGLLVQWAVRRDGELIATSPARACESYECPDVAPGKYEIVLQSWKYVDYKKQPTGEFINSKFVNISEPVSYTI